MEFEISLDPGVYTISGSEVLITPVRLTQVLTKSSATDYSPDVRDTQTLTKTSATDYSPDIRDTQALTKAMSADYGATNIVRETQALTKSMGADYGATNPVRDTQVLVKTFGLTRNAYALAMDPGVYVISGTSVEFETNTGSHFLSLESGSFGILGSSITVGGKIAGNRAPFCTCCIGGCCDGRAVFPDCITLELNVDCCSDSPATVTLCQDGGPPIPEFPDIRWTGNLPSPFCLFDGTDHLSTRNVGIGCLTDIETGEEGWYILIKDPSGNNIWGASQAFRLTLISCNPLLWDFGGPAGCSEEQCLIEWQLACFSGETMIETVSGTRQLQTLAVGDQIIDKDGEVVTVLKIHAAGSSAAWKLIDHTGTVTFVTPEHPFLRGQEWVSVNDVNVGDVLSGKTILQKTLIRESRLVWNLSVSGSNTFIANGFIVHNK